MTRFQRAILGLAGVTATSIGAFILTAPHAFYASYGVTLGPDPNLLSELRAPAAGLTVLGVIMLAGLFRTAWAQLAVAAAMVVFLAFPVGRMIGIAIDGMPGGSVIGALAVELLIACLLLAAFARGSRRRTVQDPLVDLPS